MLLFCLVFYVVLWCCMFTVVFGEFVLLICLVFYILFWCFMFTVVFGGVRVTLLFSFLCCTLVLYVHRGVW